jgi:UMF1 family MFS transporter
LARRIRRRSLHRAADRDLVYHLRAADVFADTRSCCKDAARGAVRQGLQELRETLARLPKTPSMLAFLIANMIYMDGLVSLFAFGGIYAAGTFGWNTIQIGTFGILLAISGTIGAWLGGRLDDKLGPKTVVAGSLVILLGAIASILLISRDTIFFIPVTPPVPDGGLFAAAR